MKGCKKSKLSRYVLAALTVGMFSMVPVAYALPVQDTTHTNTAGSAINTSVANQMGITSTASNNVMNWQSFSIANGEKVQFDTNNYLNLVRGASKSEIDGALTGGGNIYLINPNGILFGSTAQVNVGNLVASTRAIDSVDASGFESTGANPLATAVSTAAGDIINLGKLQTASVILEGNNITIQNAADITSNGTTPLTSTVTAKAAGIITVGHAVAETTTRSFTIGGTATDKTVHDYKNATVGSSGYTGKKLDGTTDNAVKESMLVENVYDLQNMDVKLDGNYMLSGDIDASDTSTWNSGAGFSPVGESGGSSLNFTGIFDGVNHTISGLYIYRSDTDCVGLFGNVNGGTIKNVGLVGGSITGGEYVGGVAGYSYNGKIKNAYNTGAVSGSGDYVGGVAGWNEGSITNAYNTGAVSGTGNSVGGVAGWNEGSITNAYNTGAVSGGSSVGGVVGFNDNGTITNAYNTGAVSGNTNVGGVVGQNYCTIKNVYNTGAVSGDYSVGGVAGYSCNGKIENAYNTGAVSGGSSVGGVVGKNDSGGSITNAYNTGVVSGTTDIGGVVGYKVGGIMSTWYATKDAAGNTINTTTSSVTYNDFGTAKTLAELQGMVLGDTGYGFDTTIWRTNATDGSTALVATTPMLQAFINKDLDSQIAHTAVQYGTAEHPLTNIYQTTGDVIMDMSTLTRNPNVGAAVYGHNLTLNNFTSAANDSSTWASYAAADEMDKTKSGNLYLNNDNGFTVNSGVELLGTTSITLSAKDSSTGTIIDYGKNTTTTLAITAKDIVLDADRVDTAAGNAKTAVTLNAAGTAKVGYTPTGTMAATVNGASVSVPGYDNAAKRTYYPTITATGGATLSEGQWIKNVTELQAMGTSANTLSKTYFLYGDIDASATKSWNQDTTDTSVYQGFVPVGNDSINFSGTFDGLNHTINGLYINRPTTNSVGLFGSVDGGAIQNVGLVGGSITGARRIGSLVGVGFQVTITNVYNTGAVTGDSYLGGVGGRITYGTIRNVYNTGTVTATTNLTPAVGGLVSQVGGIVGENFGDESGRGIITNAYNTGTVSGAHGRVGGIAGYNNGPITNAYNAGTVSGGSEVGGVVGYSGVIFETKSDIKNAYNTGTVSGQSGVGGVVGVSVDGSVITNALWAKDLSYETETGKSKPTKAVGNVDDSDTVKSVALADMKKAATYSNWSNDGDDTIDSTVASEGNKGTAWRIYEGYTTPLLTSFFKGVVTVTGLDSKETTYNGTTQTVDTSGAVYSPADIDTSHIYTGGSGRDAGIYALVYSDQQGYDLINAHTLTITPKTLTATLTGKTGDTYAFTKTYDGTQSVTQALGNNYTFATGDVISGDTVSIATNNNGVYTDDKNVANDKAITFSSITLTGTDAGNYTIADTLSGSVGQITKKNITADLTGTNSVSKEYDGNTTVTAALTQGTNYQFTGMVAGDTLSLTGTGTYADNKNAGDDKPVSFTGLSLTGTDAGNYNLTTTSLTGNVGQITKKDITASLNALSDVYVFTKTYDGGTDVKQVLGNNYSFATGDIESVDAGKVSLTAGTGTYADKNVENTKKITFGSLVLDGDEAGNYNLTTTSLTGNVGQITSKELTITLAGNNTFTKVYDGTTDVIQKLAGNYNISGIVGTEKVDIDIDSAGVSGTYADKNAADGKLVQFTVSGLTGADKANYSLESTTLTGNVGKITPKALTATLTGDNVFTKVYDGTTVVNQTLGTNYTLDGIVADSDKVSLTAGSGAYNDKNVGDSKTITFSGLTLSGEGAGNYTIASALSGNVGQITKKNITADLTGTNSVSKEYDGNTTVTAALTQGTNYQFTGMVAGDTLSLTGTGTYADNKNAGDDKPVSFTGLSLTGTEAGNYNLTTTSLTGNVGQITPKALTATLTGDNVFTKVYDGTTAVSQALGTNYTLNGIVADSDKVLLSAGSGAYNDKNAGDNKIITFSGLVLTGTGAGNYTIASTMSGAVGQITRKTITGSLASGYSFDKVYNGTTTASLGNGYTLSGVVAGDKVPLTAAKGFYDSSAIGDRTVTFSGFSINDGNYLLSMADSLSGIGKITSNGTNNNTNNNTNGVSDHNYSDALAGVSSFFGANPSDGYTIFSGAPGDYVARAANGQTRYSTGTAQAAPAGATQESLTWYNGPLTLTIVNGDITLPKDILLGSTYDTRTVVIKGSDSYQI